MKKKKKKTNKTLLIILFILLFLTLILGFVFYNSTISPVSKDENEEVTIKIENDWYGKKVLSYLEEAGVIRDGDIAYYYAKLKGNELNFKAGKYKVSPSWNLDKIFEYISDSKNAIEDIVTIRFKEGNRAKDYAKEISENTNLSYEELYNSWNDETYIRGLMSKYSFLTEDIFNEDSICYLEGYLFPDTYEFYCETTIDDVTYKMLNKTNSIYNEYKSLFDDNDYSIHEIFTLASIIQREAGNIDDMQLVSSVFHNRLDIGMQLQSSVTVCYALDIGIEDENWVKCEITQTERSPYNTYQVFGLPPGPICNPNKNAIYAALNPAESDYLFFIGNVCGDGETYFAETYQEQLENQERYLTCY